MGDCGGAAVYSTEILEEGEEGLRKYRSLRNLRQVGRESRGGASAYAKPGEGTAAVPQFTRRRYLKKGKKGCGNTAAYGT